MKILISASAVVLLLFFFIRLLEQKSLYFPFRDIEVTPGDMGLAYEEIFLETRDSVRISGWYVPSPVARATVLFCHGNGGNISHRLEKIKILHDMNVNILIFDYRGYGTSEGRPSEKGLYRDGEAAYAWLVNEKNVPPREIIGYGESLGAAVVIDLAAKHELGGLIIEGGFTSVRDMARHYLPFIPVFVYRSSFDSQAKIGSITSPKLHLHSPQDEIVPFKLGKKLYELAPEPKEFVELRGGHNDAFLVSRDVFAAGIDAFIGRL